MVYVPDTTGHIDTLTPDQEVKLSELWSLVLTSIASVLASVYDTPLPAGGPDKVFETLTRINDPTPAAIIAALNGKEPASTTATDGTDNAPSNEEAENKIRAELSTRKVTPKDFAAVFTQLRENGVSEGEIQSMGETLSTMTPEEMCFAVLKTIKQEHPDSLLLRFLRARKWDVGKAFGMLTSNILWRKQMHVDDDILPNGELYQLQRSRDTSLPEKERKEAEAFMNQLRTGKSFLHGFDRAGRPVNYVRVKIHRPGAQSEDTLERYIVHIIESTRLIVMPPVETGTIVFDMSGFSLSNMEYAPVKFIIKCFEANYPESLGILLIHNAPWGFSAIWRLIQGWMDPNVAAKVHFTKSVKDLDKFIARENIPRELGGDENYNYEYIEPAGSEDDVMKDTQARDKLLYERLSLAIKMLATTAAWTSTTAGDAAAKTEIKGRREAVIKDLSANYWRLDAYLRARSQIDRDGTLKPDGTVVNGK